MGLFNFGNKGGQTKSLNWTELSTVNELEKALARSSETPCLFFKHSTRCSISSMALSRFENDWNEDTACELYFIDLIANREVSNKLSELTGVQHQSPQTILVENGESILDASHSAISAEELMKKL